MKHILYYDKDIINSYAAQIFKGLPTKSSEEVGDNTGETFVESLKDSMKKASASIGFVSGEYVPSEKSSGNSESKSQYAKELTEKVFHDNMLMCIIENLSKDKKLKMSSKDVQIGDYVCLANNWRFLDVEYLKKLFNKSSWEKIKKVMTIDEDKETKNNVQSSDYNVDKLRKVLDAFEIVLPFSHLIVSDKFCAPIKPEYLRETLCEINFKYASDRIKLFGRVTNQLKSVEADKSDITDLLPLVGNVATSLIAEGSYIITPIALYVE